MRKHILIIFLIFDLVLVFIALGYIADQTDKMVQAAIEKKSRMEFVGWFDESRIFYDKESKKLHLEN